MRRVLISIDHKWRDLPGHVLLGELLEKRGIKVSYCRNGLEKYYLNHSYYDVVIINHIFEKSRQALVKEHSLKGTSFVILPTEGIPTLEDYTDFALGVELDYSAIRCYAFWNGFYQNRFEFNTTLSNQNIYIAGVPRFDFYKHKNLQKHIHFNFTTSGPSKKILWATNFTQAQFHAPDKFDLMEADARRLGYKDTLESMQGSLQEVAKKDFFAREKSLEIMLKYIQQHSDVLLIIKPHPSEDGTYYKNYFKMNNISSKRVKIIKNEYIWDLLMWCDVEVSRSCTTAIEAWHLNKPTIDLNPDPSWYHSSKHASGSYQCHNYEELVIAMDKGLEQDWHEPTELRAARDAFINKYCEGRDGNRTRALAEKIFSLTSKQKKSRNSMFFNIKLFLIYLSLRYLDNLPHNLRAYGFSYILGNRIDKFGRADKHFHNKDIRKWKNILSDVVK